MIMKEREREREREREPYCRTSPRRNANWGGGIPKPLTELYARAKRQCEEEKMVLLEI